MGAPASRSLCTVAMCTKPIRRRQGGLRYCYAHYMKNWRYGTPTPNHIPYREDLTGRVFDQLTVTGYAGGGEWACDCNCGTKINRRAAELKRHRGVATCGNKKNHRGEDINYFSAHGRVLADRGKASGYDCVGCGERAQQWAYDHKDGNALYEYGEKYPKGIPYSLDPWHYQPMCIKCHKALDRAVAKERRALVHSE